MIAAARAPNGVRAEQNPAYRLARHFSMSAGDIAAYRGEFLMSCRASRSLRAL